MTRDTESVEVGKYAYFARVWVYESIVCNSTQEVKRPMNLNTKGGVAGGTMSTIIMVLVTNLLLSIGIIILQQPFTDIVTKEVTGSCVFGSATASSCTLNPPSFYRYVNPTTGEAAAGPPGELRGFDTSEITVTGATANSTTFSLSANGATLNITNAGTGTAVTGGPKYLGRDSENTLGALWLALPMLTIIGGVTGLFGMASSVSLQGSGTGRIMSGIVALIVGATLVTVQSDFINNAQVAYAAVPQFVGLDVIWILLELSFIFIILAIAFGLVSGNSVFGYAKEKIGGRKKRMKRAFSM